MLNNIIAILNLNLLLEKNLFCNWYCQFVIFGYFPGIWYSKFADIFQSSQFIALWFPIAAKVVDKLNSPQLLKEVFCHLVDKFIVLIIVNFLIYASFGHILSLFLGLSLNLFAFGVWSLVRDLSSIWHEGISSLSAIGDKHIGIIDRKGAVVGEARNLERLLLQEKRAGSS